VKVIILSAGQGSRLKLDMPKSLLKLTDEITILDLLIKNFKKILNLEFSDIIVVVGYKKELFFDCYPYLDYVVNEDYLNSGPAKSLLKGLKAVNLHFKKLLNVS